MKATTAITIKASNNILHFQVNGKDFTYTVRPNGKEVLKVFNDMLIGRELAYAKRTHVLYTIARELFKNNKKLLKSY